MAFDPAVISAPFRMQPGLGRLPAGQRQLTPNHPGDAHLTAKLAVLREHSRQALCSIADWDAGPALTAIAEQAATEHPDAWSQPTAADGRSTGSYAPLLGWGLRDNTVEGVGDPAIGDCLRSLPAPWPLAGLLCLAFAEDFAVIDGTPGAAGRIPWLAVCLPSHWIPQQKLGRGFADVHAPVADNDLLIRAAEQLPRLVCGPQRWQRFVWTITPNPHLDGHPLRVPVRCWPPEASASDLAKIAYLRIEHQTFIPIADQQQAVFTIKVDLHRLVDVLEDSQVGTATGHALHAALATMSDAVLAYRGLDTARDRLLGWLHERSTRRAGG